MTLKKDNKGFTLMEMLIVVAIIAILIAIMIPVFNAQLEKSREAADAANIRSAYATAMVTYLDDSSKDGTSTVKLTQETDGWQNESLGTTLSTLVGADNYTGAPKAGGSCTVTVTNGVAKIAFSE